MNPDGPATAGADRLQRKMPSTSETSAADRRKSTLSGQDGAEDASSFAPASKASHLLSQLRFTAENAESDETEQRDSSAPS